MPPAIITMKTTASNTANWVEKKKSIHRMSKYKEPEKHVPKPSSTGLLLKKFQVVLIFAVNEKMTSKDK